MVNKPALLSIMSPLRLNAPLGHLAIPGSHNSFSSALDVTQGVAVDESDFMRKLGDSCCGAALNIIHRWSANQSMGMVEQLNAGIRYFDLRVCKKPDTGLFHFLHGLYGDEVKSSLAKIISFFEKNTKEVAILDMNHFYNMEPSDHDRLLGEIGDTLKELLVPFGCYRDKLWSLTLKNVWQYPDTRRVIVIYHNPFNERTFPNIWNKTVIQSPWPNKADKTILINWLEENYTGEKRPSGYGFYVWQGCLTPTTGTIMKHLCGTLQNVLARPATDAFVRWVKTKAPGERGINICLVDFVEMSGFIHEVIALNNVVTDDKQDI